MDRLKERLLAWRGEEVALDLVSPYVVLGTLTDAGEDFVELRDADLHDLRDSKSTRELYLVKAARHGLRPNRATVLVRLAEVVAVARLADVAIG